MLVMQLHVFTGQLSEATGRIGRLAARRVARSLRPGTAAGRPTGGGLPCASRAATVDRPAAKARAAIDE
jgi:hypothetical protein